MSTFTMDTSTSRATPSPVPGKRTTAPSIRARKADGKTEQPIVMLTAYTMRMAQLLDPHCDLLLVGDSLGQVMPASVVFDYPTVVALAGYLATILPELIEAAEQEDVDDYDDFTEDELLQQLSERLN